MAVDKTQQTKGRAAGAMDAADARRGDVRRGVDAHVGQRLRQRRWMLGLTQQQVGDRIGIKFQQVQKYETGQNRVSASRLWDLANALEAPVAYFFEGLDGASDVAEPGDASTRAATGAVDPMSDRETIELVRGYYDVPPPLREKLFEFVKALGAASRSDPATEEAAAESKGRVARRSFRLEAG